MHVDQPSGLKRPRPAHKRPLGRPLCHSRTLGGRDRDVLGPPIADLVRVRSGQWSRGDWLSTPAAGAAICQRPELIAMRAESSLVGGPLYHLGTSVPQGWPCRSWPPVRSQYPPKYFEWQVH